MGGPPVGIVTLSDEQSIAAAAQSESRPSSASPATVEDDGSRESALKTTLVNLIPPATLVAIALFWIYGPEALIANEWSFLAVGAFTTLFVLGLEFVLERHRGWRLNRLEFATDFFYVMLNYTVIAWVSTALTEDPLKAVKSGLGITTEWITQLPFLVQVAIVIFMFEFGQYWMHRLMHNWRPFWLTHAPHHHITQLNAMKGWVGNPLELVLISLGVVALFDFDQAAIFCAFNINSAIAIYAHANVRSNPPLFYSFFFTTIRHHSLHHTALSYEDTRCNYGNSLILLDRIFGTYREGESSVVGQDDRRRLSIYEQFMFPFQPTIDAIKARRAASSS